jgi:hypothetical protein
LLIPTNATESVIFQAALAAAISVVFVRARLMFEQVRPIDAHGCAGRHEAASHGSALFGFGVDLTRLAHLGVLVRSPS